MRAQKGVPMINQLAGYFDQMAAIIRRIEDKEIFREKDFASLLGDKNHQIYFELISFFPKLIRDNRTAGSLMISDIGEDFSMAVSQVLAQDNIAMLHLLLYYMDRGIGDCYDQMIGFEDDIEVCDALNDNYHDTGIIILRKVGCRWEMRQPGKGLNGLLQNFYYIDQNRLDGMRLRNYILDRTAVMRSRKTSLKIAVSPITRKKSVEFSAPYEGVNGRTGIPQKLFRVERVLGEKLITDQVIENIHIAGAKETDILVFPEMLGTEEMLRKVMEALESDWKTNVPALIVFPSVWEKTENDLANTNKSYMILNGEEVLFEQHKRCDYKYDTEGGPVYEDINRDRDKNNILNVIHVEGLGRICIIICYDYLDEENQERIMKNIRPTLVCTPSFSTGSFHFKTLAEAFFKQSCNLVWCNTCSAAHETDKDINFEIIGLVTTLSKQCEQFNPNSFERIFVGKTKCGRENCKNCIYYAEIPLNRDSVKTGEP